MSENSTHTPETVELAPVEAATLAKFARAAEEVQLRAQGALLMVLAQRGLDGTWDLSPDGKTLIRRS